MQSDRNSSKTYTVHEPTSLLNHLFEKSSERILIFARHEYGRVGVFRIKMHSLVQKLKPLKNCHFSNCCHLFASHCMCILFAFFLISNVYWTQPWRNNTQLEVNLRTHTLNMAFSGERQHFRPNIWKTNICSILSIYCD